MAHFTGYLLGKVQLDGAIRSEVLASLVESLVQKYQAPESTKKQFKFNENHKYSVECSERGLRLTSPGYRSKDEGFESDSESLRSVRVTEAVELDLSGLIANLELGPDTLEKETERGALHSSPSSPGGSLDAGSMSSSSGIPLSEDSSSGNGSDSDEFGGGGEGTSPFWESLPNLSSFQSHPIEDLLFCHCDALHPSTLVWVVRHTEKMLALVTAFRTRAEAEELFQTYRDLRAKLKPIKYKINPILGFKGVGNQSPPSTSGSTASESPGENLNFASLPPVYPTEVLSESQSAKSSALFSYEPKSLAFDLESPMFNNNNHSSNNSNAMDNASTTSTLTREPLSRTGSNSLSLHTHVYVSNPNIVRHGGTNASSMDERDEEGSETTETASEEVATIASSYMAVPTRPQRKVQGAMTIGSTGGKAMAMASLNLTPGSFVTAKQASSKEKPVLLVPLKNESVSAPKSTYPKESYLYHVMGRSSSTFAPYQRSLNFLPHQFGPNGGDYVAWGNGNGGHLLVPFSSWLELAEMPKGPHAVNQSGGPGGRKAAQYAPKGRISARSNSRLSASIGAKGTTSKILLRDAAGRDSMWASLSQRFKKNFRETLIPKLNGMWSHPSEGGRKKRTNKKVTFNAWATVQMV